MYFTKIDNGSNVISNFRGSSRTPYFTDRTKTKKYCEYFTKVYVKNRYNPSILLITHVLYVIHLACNLSLVNMSPNMFSTKAMINILNFLLIR